MALKQKERASSSVEQGTGPKACNFIIGSIMKIPVGLIERNRDQPRKVFIEEDIALFAESLLSRGDVEQPLEVVIRGEGQYVMIVDGERRWRSAKKAGLKELSCRVCPSMTDEEVFISSAKANFGRKDMTIVEQAFVAKRFIEKHGWTQEKVAKEMGLSQGTISNMLKVFKLHESIQSLLLYGKIDNGLALMLATYPKENQNKLLDILQHEIKKKGGPLQTIEAVTILRRETERQGVRPLKNKKGKVHKSHAQLVLGEVLRRGEYLAKSLEELRKIEMDILQIQTKPHIMYVRGELRELYVFLAKVLDDMEVLA